MCCVGSERYVRLSPPFPNVNMMNVDKLFRFRHHYCNDVSRLQLGFLSAHRLFIQKSMLNGLQLPFISV